MMTRIELGEALHDELEAHDKLNKTRMEYALKGYKRGVLVGRREREAENEK